MTDYEIKLKKPLTEKIMQDLKVEQGFNHFGLEITWKESTVFMNNISAYKDIPGIGRAFDANAKFILAFLCEMHTTDGKLYKGTNIIDAYYGNDEPNLADDIWNSIRRWISIAFR